MSIAGFDPKKPEEVESTEERKIILKNCHFSENLIKRITITLLYDVNKTFLLQAFQKP